MNKILNRQNGCVRVRIANNYDIGVVFFKILSDVVAKEMNQIWVICCLHGNKKQ